MRWAGGRGQGKGSKGQGQGEVGRHRGQEKGGRRWKKFLLSVVKQAKSSERPEGNQKGEAQWDKELECLLHDISWET